jgi:general secretion pathway protein K
MVTAVMVVSVAAGVAAYLIAAPERWGRRAANMAYYAQAETTCRAAVDWARVIVYQSAIAGPSRIGENGPEVIDTFPVDDGKLSLVLNDAQGKFNLNNLVKQGKASDRDIAMFRRLLASLKLEPGLADALVDWMDSDDQPRPGGGESSLYMGKNPPYRAANRLLSDVGELVLVNGFGEKAVNALSPYVIALPERAMVNVNTAGAVVLTAVFKGLTISDAESLIALRRAVRFENTADVRGKLPKSVTETMDTDFAVESKYFMVTVASSFNHAKIGAEALLELLEKKFWPKVAWYRIT